MQFLPINTQAENSDYEIETGNVAIAAVERCRRLCLCLALFALKRVPNME